MSEDASDERMSVAVERIDRAFIAAVQRAAAAVAPESGDRSFLERRLAASLAIAHVEVVRLLGPSG